MSVPHPRYGYWQGECVQMNGYLGEDAGYFIGLITYLDYYNDEKMYVIKIYLAQTRNISFQKI